MQPAKINYKVYQGSTFEESYRWESQTKVYVPISAISKTAPCVITTTGTHVLPVGWRFQVTGVTGMKDINTTSDQFYLATGTTSTSITINEVNSSAYSTYTSGGVVEYNQPVDLANYSARMQLRETLDSTTVLHEATTANNQIVIDNTYKSITLTIPAATTQNFTFSTAVYSLELYTSTGRVVPFLTGSMKLNKEVTR